MHRCKARVLSLSSTHNTEMGFLGKNCLLKYLYKIEKSLIASIKQYDVQNMEIQKKLERKIETVRFISIESYYLWGYFKAASRKYYSKLYLALCRTLWAYFFDYDFQSVENAIIQKATRFNDILYLGIYIIFKDPLSYMIYNVQGPLQVFILKNNFIPKGFFYIAFSLLYIVKQHSNACPKFMPLSEVLFFLIIFLPLL